MGQFRSRYALIRAAFLSGTLEPVTVKSAEKPFRAVAIKLDNFNDVDVAALFQAGFHLVVEGFRFHAIVGNVQRRDQCVRLGVVCVDAIGNGGDWHIDTLAVIQMHMILVSEDV